MYSLRIPSAKFAITALAASARAGYLGTVLILVRRLEPQMQAKLRDFWTDLNDLTGNELLVLTTGLQTTGHNNCVRSDRLQREIFADGVAIARSCDDGFEKHFEDLLSVATPTPDMPPTDTSTGRLIAPEGVTNIRQGLDIYERQLPALLVRSNEQNREILICLGNGNDMISPVLVISKIVELLEDIPHKIVALQNSLNRANEAVCAQSSEVKRQRSELSAALQKLIPLRKTILCDAATKALKELGFVFAQNSRPSSSRLICSRAGSASQNKVFERRPRRRFDLFLIHNSQDKATIRVIAQKLENRGLNIWYDGKELALGQPSQPLLEDALKNSKATAVLVGKNGLGRWADEEMQVALRLAIEAKRPVIPVLLPGAPPKPNLPLFLANRTWVDLRSGVTDEELDRLKLSIEGGGSPSSRNHDRLKSDVRLRKTHKAARKPAEEEQ